MAKSPPPATMETSHVAPSSAGKVAGSGEIVSPLAGRVISIGVEPGKDVKEGDHVLTLEAMKMNTFVFAPKAGKIKEIKTTVGEAVQEGDVLLLME
jgi:biotin carboxyl carrier protein